jgi:hypothetical protein
MRKERDSFSHGRAELKGKEQENEMGLGKKERIQNDIR